MALLPHGGPAATSQASSPLDGAESQPVVLLWPPGAFVVDSATPVVPTVRSDGPWIVRSLTAAYQVDLDGAVAARFPLETLIYVPCRDREDLRLESIAAVVGAPMRVVLTLRHDGVPTHRQTTCVVAIDSAPEAPDSPVGRGKDPPEASGVERDDNRHGDAAGWLRRGGRRSEWTTQAGQPALSTRPA